MQRWGDLVDIRPPQHFADYNLPGSMNADVAELIDNPAYLAGAGPLIIVDRDGSLAMMVAGVLSQKTQRNVKALYGGLEAYWTESSMGTMMNLPASSGGAGMPPVPAVRPPVTVHGVESAITPPKRRFERSDATVFEALAHCH